MKNQESYSNIALSEMYLKNPKEAKTPENLIHLRKARNMEIYREQVRKILGKKQKTNNAIAINSQTSQLSTFGIANITNTYNITDKELLEQIEVLKSQLLNAGIKPISEMVSYEDAKEFLKNAIKAASESDSHENIKEVERWDEFIKNHPKYVEEEKEKEEAWKNDNFLKNIEALEIQQKIIPKNIYSGASVDILMEKGLKKELAVRLMRNRVLWLVHMDPNQIALTHLADLRFKYSFAGLDLIEMRALYACMPEKFEHDDTGEKMQWLSSIREKLSDMINQEKNNTLISRLKRNQAYLDKKEPIKFKKINLNAQNNEKNNKKLSFMEELALKRKKID
tara:strand:- start:3464 stop:4477 length:1014 start_codon:yes stop_codon:yes gene_type:complete